MHLYEFKLFIFLVLPFSLHFYFLFHFLLISRALHLQSNRFSFNLYHTHSIFVSLRVAFHRLGRKDVKPLVQMENRRDRSQNNSLDAENTVGSVARKSMGQDDPVQCSAPLERLGARSRKNEESRNSAKSGKNRRIRRVSEKSRHRR